MMNTTDLLQTLTIIYLFIVIVEQKALLASYDTYIKSTLNLLTRMANDVDKHNAILKITKKEHSKNV